MGMKEATSIPKDLYSQNQLRKKQLDTKKTAWNLERALLDILLFQTPA